jgi:ABC-2 type transport system permease protein
VRRLLAVELFKIMKRPRTYIGFGTILFIILAFQGALAAEGEAIIGLGIQNLKSVFRFEGEIITVNFVTYMLMTTLIIHVPILVCLVTGDMISGEAGKGSLRLLLQRPYTRGQIFMAKWLAGAIYTIALLLFAALITYLLGYLLFGTGDLIVFRRGINVIEAYDVGWRFIYGFGIGVLAMLVVQSLSMMISSFVNNSIGPIVGTIAIIIILNVLTALMATLLKPILPYVFTTHFTKWQYFFDAEIEWDNIYNAIIVLISYIVVFTLIGWWNFKRKDILT